MEYCLDASALLSGRQFAGDLITSPSILPELARQGLSSPERSFVENRVKVYAPTPQAADRVAAAARETGDDAKLSPADAELLALALERGATVVTDDYAIQNVASVLEVAYAAVMQSGIQDVVLWGFRCSGCGKSYDTSPGECPVCGASVRPVRKRSTPR